MISPPSRAEVPVFTIVISEKGGAERREEFNQAEVNIGRVQGSELMLPKGNVSKRHARLLYRDGRFIVTDLNSTNGTYVNRRRISQATIVREGDRIYIGDFVLRIEMPSPTRAGDADVSPSGRVARVSQSDATSSEPDQSSVTHTPNDDSRYPAVPGPPRVPSRRGSGQHSLADSSERVPTGRRAGAEAARDPSSADRSVPGVLEAPPDPRAQAHREAMTLLAERVSDSVDLAALSRGEAPDPALDAKIQEALADGLAQIEGSIDQSVDRDRLMDDVRTELTGLGALAEALEDDQVTEIACPHFESVFAFRSGQRFPIEPPFSSETALKRAVARLCRSAGQPLGDGEAIVNRVLADGSQLTAVVGGAAVTGTMLSIQNTRRVQATFDELVRNGAVSRAMARFLQQCVAARANILVVGPKDSSRSAVMSALLSAADGPVAVFEGGSQFAASHASVTRFSLSKAEEDVDALVKAATRMPGARLFVDGFSGSAAAAVLDAIGDGAEGVVATASVPSLRRGLGRLVADLAMATGAAQLASIRESLVSSFDVVVEVARLRDGRYRVMRVAELVGGDDKAEARDIFSFTIERTAAGGSVEGTFHASGTVPRIVDEMAARGITVESSLFTRPPSR